MKPLTRPLAVSSRESWTVPADTIPTRNWPLARQAEECARPRSRLRLQPHSGWAFAEFLRPTLMAKSALRSLPIVVVLLLTGLRATPQEEPPLTPISLPESERLPLLPRAKLPEQPIFLLELRQQTTPLTGRVIQYNHFVMGWTSNGDIIVTAAQDGRFVRLVYSPLDFGFDAPEARESQLLPRQMTTDKVRLWTFQIHPPLSDEERGPCAPPPKKMLRRNGKPILLDTRVFVYVPGNETAKLPPVESLPCFVIESWSEARSGLDSH